MNSKKCAACGKTVQPHDGVYVTRKEDLQYFCSNCYNDMIAQYLGVVFENPSFDPVTLKDTDDINHTFHFRTRLLGDQVIVDALELLDDGKQGYEFSILGDAEEDMFGLFKRLFERIKRSMNRKHIEPDDITGYRITMQDTVRGYITSDIDADDFAIHPVLVIDGKEISWRQFGRMLSTFDGFNFKLEIFDKTEEK